MAKQVGPLFITGTIDGIIFYKLGDQYYLRSKGSYKSAKYMRKDPRLKRTMEKANQFGEASKITKEVYYRQLPREVRRQGLFGQLTGMVNSWLQKGKSREEARELLITHCQALVPEGMPTPITPVTYVAEPSPKTAEVDVAIPLIAQKPVTAAPTRKTKKARYLSHWKIKHCGRLQVPLSDAGSLLLSVSGYEKRSAGILTGCLPAIPYS
jgi:hypothetical protein